MSDMKKKVEGFTPEQQEERERLIMEIMCLAFRFHQESGYCVFIDFSGHVDQLSISIRESQSNYQTNVADSSFYTVPFRHEESQDPNSWLKYKRNVLLVILEQGEIDTSMCEEVVTQIINYEF